MIVTTSPLVFSHTCTHARTVLFSHTCTCARCTHALVVWNSLP